MKLLHHTVFPEEYKEQWDALLPGSNSNVPFLHYAYLKGWWHTRGGGEWADAELVIITAQEGDKLIGVAPLFYTPDHQGRPALMLLGSVEVSDYLDLIVSEENLVSFLDALLPFLTKSNLPDWKVLDFYNVLRDSATLAALETVSQKQGWAYNSEIYQHSPYIPLPGDWEAYLANIDKKQRHEIRRKIRRLEGSEVPSRWYVVEDGEMLETEIEAFLHLMEQERDKADFLTEYMREHMRMTIRWAFEAGFLVLAFLEIDGKKAAAKLCFNNQNRLWAYNSGIEKGYEWYSPGWVLLGYLLKWANEQHYSEFDFMRGDEKYKYRFGAQDRFVMRATVSLPG
jgi:CelD/BcsL family acetyltransferase involved in cellulose biosynthesis